MISTARANPEAVSGGQKLHHAVGHDPSQAPGIVEPNLQWAPIGAARGKGYMAEAGRSVLDFLFEETGRELLHTTIHPENSFSQATALRLGGAPNGATVVEDIHILDVWAFSRTRI